MKHFFALMFFVFCNVLAYGQEIEVKKIIYNDLFNANSIYDGCIIYQQQDKVIFTEEDTIIISNSLESIKNDFESRVIIEKIDSFQGFYFVEVRFDLLPGYRYKGLFSDFNFNYVLYRGLNGFYKINGFLVSDIMLIYEIRKKDIRKLAKINAPKKFEKYLEDRRVVDVSKYLHVSVFKNINNLGYNFNFRPYVKDSICW